MSYKDVLALVLSADADTAAIEAAAALAEAQGGKATVLLFETQPDPVVGVDVYVVSDVWARVLEKARQDFLQERAKVEALLARSALPMTLRTTTIPLSLAGPRAGVEARYCDIAVMTSPQGEQRWAMFEGALFGPGRPVLVVPTSWRKRAIGRNIVIGWNASREAARALADAEPLLDRADRITIVTVDAKPTWSGHGEAPGVDIAAHLARRELKVEVRNVDGQRRGDAAALLDECNAVAADLLVIGGYGHARLQETVFGGVTRALASGAPIPVLMSH